MDSRGFPVDHSHAHMRLHKRHYRRQQKVDDDDDDDDDTDVPPGFSISTRLLTETFTLLRTTKVEVQTMRIPVLVTSIPVKPISTPASTSAKPTSSSIATSSSISRALPLSSTATSLSSLPVTTPSATPTPTPTPTPSPSSTSQTQSSASTTSSDIAAGAKESDTAAASASKGLSGGAVGGIVAAALIVAIAIAIFLMRKAFLRRRKNKRNTWGAGIYPKPDLSPYMSEKQVDNYAPPLPEKPRYTPATTPMANQSAFALPPPPPTSYANLPPPSPSMMVSPPPMLQPSLGSPAVPLSQALGPGSPVISVTPATGVRSTSAYAYVRCTFLPSLPDELSISTGEMVRVLGEFDDGWALCANARGEQGVVPLECLDKGGNGQMPHGPVQGGYLGQGTGDWRMSRRASSLYAAQHGNAVRY
ncbi:unnamed protein product [Somion occarium]|uniref:SH3 domain-containing protein n=1 Tax=Somion occarium TaxID=3059160 RepID=A0ABP1DD14_9APHY